ncbi:hypothetical protein ABZZ37_26800 [Streptomyces sp. NPDC006464]|uniref:PIN domain-containing protein n=1 Tax=Streptomyces sp. NPDC006464 TaxID=3154305 RepID=UPI0033A35C15
MASSLTYLVPGADAATRQSNALTVLRIVMQEYLRTANTSEAIELSDAWQEQRIAQEGEKSRNLILSTREEIVSRLDESSGFDSTLGTLSSLRRREAEAIRGKWKGIESALAAFDGDRLNRGEILSQWVDNPPSWLSGAPAEALLWLASMAADYCGEECVARKFYEMAISAGAYPHDYWVARSAISCGNEETPADIRRYIASRRRGDHPFLAAVEAFIDERFDEAITLIDSWDSQEEAQAAVSASLKVSSLIGLGRITEAIVIAKTAAEQADLSGLATRAAELLLVRATSGRSEHRLMDCQEALSLALQARNRRRSWFGDSVEPLVIAVKAAQLSGDIEKSWSLMQLPPHGEALPHEIKDKRLQSQAALTAALTRRFDEARQLLSQVDDAFTKAQVEAVMAEVALGEGDDASELRNLWRRAWSLASNDSERLFAAMGMAESGADLPDLSELAPENSDAVEEIKLVAKVMAGSSENLAALRIGATKSRLLVVKLAQHHFINGEFTLAAETLKAGAERWNDAHLMSMAAARFQEANQKAEARSAARSAMHLGGPGWAGAGQMYALLVEVESADGNYEAAADAARSLLALDPHDDNARWALVKCLIRRVKVDEAWLVLSYRGEPTAPRTKEEALIWLGLSAKKYVGADFAGKALGAIQNWSDDEEVLGRFLQTFHAIGPRSAELPLTDSDRERLAAAAREFESKFPESIHWRAVSLGPDDHPLAPLESQLREDHERTKELRRQVSDGNLPLGMLAMATGRTYTEAIIRRAAGRVYAGDPNASDAESLGLSHAKDCKVVVDPTAIHSLSILDSDSAELLLGSLPAVVTTDQLYRDALQCRDVLALASDMQIVWDETAGHAAVSITAQEDVELLRVRSNRILELLGAMQRVPRPELRVLTQFTIGSVDWITGLDYALEHGLVYWSDDRVLRTYARSRGVPTFGTVSLLKQSVESMLISEDERLILEAELLRNYYVDLPFSREIYTAGATADAWNPLGVASALTRRHVWDRPEEAAEFAIHASRQASESFPDGISAWIGAAAVGLVRASDTPDSASRNLQILLRKVFSQSWLAGHFVGFVLTGIRMGVADVDGVTDPTGEVLGDYYAALVEKVGHAIAANCLMSFMATASDEDKSLAARIILTHNG